MSAGNRTTTLGLHICPSCGSQFVQPTGWERAAKPGHWEVERRCPECEWCGQSLHAEPEIDDYDERLDLGAQELVTALEGLERANMQESVETFIAALNADLIVPEDF